MADQKGRTRLVLTCLWFAALAAPVGASLVSVDAEKASFAVTGIEQPAGTDQQGDPGMVDLGGALYSPFSTAIEPATPRTDAALVTPGRQEVKHPTLDLVTAAVTAGAAAGFVVALVRLFIAT